MTPFEFVQEVRNSEIYINNFENIYSKFRFYQNKSWRALKEFHRVCVQCNIKYQLAFGTLLGVIRDGGQIPWDYDVDVFVPIIQRSELVEALRKNLSEDYYFTCTEEDIRCKNELIRIAPKGYRSEVIHVDIFFLCPEPDNEEDFLKHTKKIRKVCKARYYKSKNIYMEFLENKKRGVYYLLRKMPFLLYPYSLMHRKYIELCSYYDYDSSNRFINANGFAGTYYLIADDMRDTIEYITKDGAFFIPVNYKSVLNREFGNYEEYLPLEDRIKEMLNNYNRIELYNSKFKEE